LRFALRHQFVDVVDRVAGGANEEPWQECMDEAGAAGQQQPKADSKGVTGVFGITFPDILGMLEKQLIQHVR